MVDRPFVIHYKPIPVKELLRKMKDEASLVLDMSFYSLVYEDHEIASEAEKIDENIDNEFNLLAIQLMVAARDIEDAERVLPALRLGMAIDWVSEAASDISVVVLKGYPVARVVKAALEATEEIYLRIEADDRCDGKKIREFKEMFGAVDVIAIRRAGVVIVNPSDELVLKKGDVLILRGDREDILKVAKEFGIDLNIPTESFSEEEKEVATRLALLKNLAEIAFDLAVYSLLYQDQKAAEEVLEIESFMDEESAKLELEVMRLIQDKREVYSSTVLVRALEKITDAATGMAQLALSGNEVHPVLKEVAEEGEERILVLIVKDDCDMTINDLEQKLDGTVLAIYIENLWVPLPNGSTKLNKGMKLLVRVFGDVEEDLKELESCLTVA